MRATHRFTSTDLEAFPDNDGKRYEIIDGELYVSKQPHLYHQLVCTAIVTRLKQWSDQHMQGRASIARGLVFAEDDVVAPDIVWMSTGRMATILGNDGKLHAAPELTVEVLSPGKINERRDREVKLNLYFRRGVDESWIVDWRGRRIEVFRRKNAQLELAATLAETDTLASPLLAGFSCPVAELFADIPRDTPGTGGRK